jgi:hypothetical protein
MTETLHIAFDDTTSEDLDVERVGELRYRLLMTPLSAPASARLGDEVELTRSPDGKLKFVRVTNSSPLITAEWFLSETMFRDPGLVELLTDVRRVGGEWERVFGGILFLHLPPEHAETFQNRVRVFISGGE